MGGSREQWGKSIISHFFELEIFQKMLKKQWKFYNFLKILKEILLFLEKFLKIFSKFYRKFREKFRKIWKDGFAVGSWGSSPKLAKILKN